MADTVEFLGTTDDVTECWRCGRTDLKSTVALRINDGEPVYFGSECAAQALGRTEKDIRTAARTADDARHQAEMAERDARDNATHQEWEAFCAPWGGIHGAIAHFGGFTAARTAWRTA